MRSFRVGLACVLALALVGTSQATELTMTPVADESGFGTLYQTLSSDYTGSGFRGVLTSRVYVDATPASQVTFVWDLYVTLAFSQIENLTLAAVFPEHDLRIGEVLGGTNGYVTGGTTKIPDLAEAFDYSSASDVLSYTWDTGNKLATGDRATMYLITTGAVDVDQLSAAVQDTSIGYCKALAPVDDPSNPDLEVPEPMSLALLALGALFVRRR